MYRIEIPIYSKEDIFRTLSDSEYSDEVYAFVSDLTGLSIDRINELINEIQDAKNN